MILIDADGFFNGDRLRRCSNTAQLHWPLLFLASNGFGRLEINYARILGRAYPTFNPFPTEADLLSYIREYTENYVLFAYQVAGRQLDTRKKFLPRYKTSSDRRNPSPALPTHVRVSIQELFEHLSALGDCTVDVEVQDGLPVRLILNGPVMSSTEHVLGVLGPQSDVSDYRNLFNHSGSRTLKEV